MRRTDGEADGAGVVLMGVMRQVHDGTAAAPASEAGRQQQGGGKDSRRRRSRRSRNPTRSRL